MDKIDDGTVRSLFAADSKDIVRFTPDPKAPHASFECSMRNGRLEVRSNEGTLEIAPKVSNVIEVRIVTWFDHEKEKG